MTRLETTAATVEKKAKYQKPELHVLDASNTEGGSGKPKVDAGPNFS